MKWMGLAGVFGCWLGGFWLFVFCLVLLVLVCWLFCLFGVGLVVFSVIPTHFFFTQKM